MVRRFSFSVLPPLSNPVNRDQLKMTADRQTERTGIPHNYSPVDLRDKEALGVTSEGLDSTYDRLRRIGNHPAADKLAKVMND